MAIVVARCSLLVVDELVVMPYGSYTAAWFVTKPLQPPLQRSIYINTHVCFIGTVVVR